MKGLSIKELSFQREDEWYIHPTSLDFAPGSFNVLLGRTYAGKTTLMRLLAGLERPTSGKVEIDGQDVSRVPVRKRDVAVVYQAFINYPLLTVYENIASPLRVRGESRKSIDEQVRRVSSLLQLDPFLKRKPKELSGGQQQRVSLARALVKRARFIFLDEPLVNLDYKLREELRSEIKSLLKEQGATVFYATTDPLEPLFFDDHVLLIKEGRVLEYGKAEATYLHPRNLEGMLLYQDPPVNIIPAEVRKGTLNCFLGETLEQVGLTDGAYTLALRPHDVRTQYQAQSHLPAQRPSKKYSFEVTLSEVRGSQTLVHCTPVNPVAHMEKGKDVSKQKQGEGEGKNIGDATTWMVLLDGVHLISLGETIELHFDWKQLSCFDSQQTYVSEFLAKG